MASVVPLSIQAQNLQRELEVVRALFVAMLFFGFLHSLIYAFSACRFLFSALRSLHSVFSAFCFFFFSLFYSSTHWIHLCWPQTPDNTKQTLLKLESLALLRPDAADHIRTLVAEDIAEKCEERYRLYPCGPRQELLQIRRNALAPTCPLQLRLKEYSAGGRSRNQLLQAQLQAQQQAQQLAAQPTQQPQPSPASQQQQPQKTPQKQQQHQT